MKVNLQKLTALLLAAIVFAQSSVNTFYVCYYYLNKTYIVQNLCENRDKPKSCCEGKCQLTKWMKSGEPTTSDSNAPMPNLKNQKEITFFFQDITPFHLSLPPLADHLLIERVSLPVEIEVSKSIFHPPSC